MTSILIADDHPLTLMGTKLYVESLGYKVSETCGNGLVALNYLLQNPADIALLDVSMPGLTGLEILDKIMAYKIPTRPILLTMHYEMSVYRKAQQSGVCGYLLKDYAQEEMAECLKTVLENGTYLSKYLAEKLQVDKAQNVGGDIEKLTFAEKKILELVANQHTTKEITEILFMSEKTVESHRRNIMHKLNLPKEKNALLIWAMKNMHKG